MAVCSAAASVAADYTVTVNRNDNRGVWEGWGCSICWWGQGLGNSAYQELHADLFFTTKTITYFGKELPGLGMNIVRYNVGGGGRGDVIDTAKENVAPQLPWFKDIDGYWVNGLDRSPASKSWDWTRDPHQRAVLQSACKRGVTWVEFFSNAPMWWMTDSNSSDGGHLQASNEADLAHYLATVAAYAQTHWDVQVRSIAPFNEPSAGWWNYPHGQEGCNIPKEQQKNVLGHLRTALEAQGLNGVQIAASDENTMKQARLAYQYFREHRLAVNREDRVVADLVDKINVHAYSGLQPWRDNAARAALRKAAGTKRIWMSEYGDNDGSGMELARTITEDVNHLRPCAWVYWQPVEPYSAWGLVNADFDKAADGPDRGKPKWVYTKYYVFAQFTRFLREGYQVLGTSDLNSIAAYDAEGKRLILITLNYGTPQTIGYDLSGFASVGTEVAITFTRTDGKAVFSTKTIPAEGKRFSVTADANTVYSIVVETAAP